MATTNVNLVKNFTTTTTINFSGAQLTNATDISANKVGTVQGYTFTADTTMANGVNLTLDSAVADHSWTLIGTSHDDVMAAGNGNDTLVATAGNDTLTGGSGSDLFKTVSTTADNVALTDYTYGEDFVYLANADVANVVTDVAATGNFTSAGLVAADSGETHASYNLVSESTNGFYKVSVKNATGDATNVWFAGTAESTMDASSETKGAVMSGRTNTVSDTIMGGAGQDTILAGSNDYVYGGSGNDVIDLLTGGKNASVVLSAVGGTDKVTNFATDMAGGPVDTVYLYDTTVDKASFQYVGGKAASGNVVVTDGTAKLNLNGSVTAIGDFALLAVKDTSGTTYNVAIAGAITGNSTIAVNDGALYDYYIGAAGNKSAVDFTKDTADLVVDLGNTGTWDDKATFSNITAITGGKGNNTLIGAAATAESITAGAGASTLWGGAGAVSDTLIGAGSSDTFVYGEGNGNDFISGFNSEDGDRVVALSGYVASVERTSKEIALSWNDGGKLTFETTTSATVNDEYDIVVGSSDYKVKIGTTAAANDFTYDSAVQYYMGSTKTDTLKVSDSDNDQIWLGGSGDSNVVYSSIDNIDASTAQGSVVLAGNSSANKITGGVGSSSLWGGMGAVSDTLVGGTGTNSFYFGQGQGSDYITSSTASDKVVLYDVALSQISSAAVTNGSMVISLTDGSSLTLTSFGSNNKVTNFELADGSTWSYDTTKKTWAKA